MITSTFCFFRFSSKDVFVSAVWRDVKMATRSNCERSDNIASRINEPIWPVAPKRSRFLGDMMQLSFSRTIETIRTRIRREPEKERASGASRSIAMRPTKAARWGCGALLINRTASLTFFPVTNYVAAWNDWPLRLPYSVPGGKMWASD